MRYTKPQLIRFVIKDLIADLRQLRRDNRWPEIQAKTEEQIRAYYTHRHTLQLNRYGWPIPKEDPGAQTSVR